jgi:hypothetical protein
MKPLTGLFLKIVLPMVIVAGVTERAAGAETVPRGCSSRCKEQYLAMPKYRQAVSRNAEREVLKKAFGEPVRQTVGNTDQLLRYRGKAFDFFVLSDSAGKEKLLGIVVKGNAAYARIPSLNMGTGMPTKWYYTANDITLGFALERCLDEFSGPHSRAYVLTPSCYFGKPGHYNYFAFQYSLVNQPCLKDIETLGLSEGLKKCPQNLPATAVYIWDDSVAEDAKQLAEFIASER